jgi:hypothetical protein
MTNGNEAVHEAIRRLLGDIDDEKVAEIVSLRPTIADVEAAFVRLSGDEDELGKSGHPLDTKVAAILEILTEDDLDEER